MKTFERTIGQEHDMGTLEKGKLANIVFLSKDPLADIANVKSVVLTLKRGKAFAPHRNRLENNRITDSGTDSGVAIDVQGEVGGLVFHNNTLRETRGAAKRTGVRIGAKVGTVEMKDNRVEGFATPFADQRKKKE